MSKQENKKTRKPTRKYQGKRNQRTNETERTFDVEDRISSPNDWKWYAQNEALLRDTASFSYNQPLGSRIYMGASAGTQGNSTSVPGIMTISIAPRLGKTQFSNDPVNIAARNIYAFVRHANSGARNYDAIDEMIYLLAMDSCYSFLAWMKRVYGTIMTYSYTNRYFPVAAVSAMGVSYRDISMHLADFRAFINQFAVKIGSFCIPASMSYMARHIWLYQGLYTDTPNNDKAQVYIYNPEAFFRYQLDTDGAGALKLVDFDRTTIDSRIINPTNPADQFGWKFQELVDFGNSLLDPICESEDMNIMSGDILKAFGAGNLYMVGSIAESYSVVPTYVEEVLDQINNASLRGRSFGPNYNATEVPTKWTGIVQSPNKDYLLSDINNWIYVTDTEVFEALRANNSKGKLMFAGMKQSLESNRILNFRHGDITPASSMVASRLTSIVTDYNGGPECILPSSSQYINSHTVHVIPVVSLETSSDSCGSEVATFAKIWYYAFPNRGENREWSLIASEDIYESLLTGMSVRPSMTKANIEMIANKSADDFRRAAFISVFDRHPAVSQSVGYAVWNQNNDDVLGADSTKFTTHLNDINYYTILSPEDLLQMNSTALLSQFNVTQYGRVAQ